MKKNAYHDYAKASEYFTDDNALLEQEIRDAEKQKKFIVWVQEFSKKIVVVIFVFYILLYFCLNINYKIYATLRI